MLSVRKIVQKHAGRWRLITSRCEEGEWKVELKVDKYNVGGYDKIIAAFDTWCKPSGDVKS